MSNNGVADLRIRVGTTGVEGATSQLDRLARKGAAAESASDGVTSSFMRIAGRAAATAGAIAGVTLGLAQLVSTIREFEKLRAGLSTATGSDALGAQAFEAIQDFATRTPFDLAQVTEAFTKLVNMGLTPSERALYSYGNTASAMGKDLMQLIEAVADATTGEFERLKEFGIKASKEGDNITFRFRGVATTVKNSSEEIENYLIKLGETNFGEGMAKRMATLDGSLSNLGDAWQQLLDTVGQQGVGDVIKASVDQAVDSIGELTEMLKSGEIPGYLDAVGIAFSGWGSDLSGLIDYLNQKWKDSGGNFETVIDFVVGVMARWPANLRAYIQTMVVEVMSFVERVQAVGDLVKTFLNPFSSGQDVYEARKAMDARLAAIAAGSKESLEAINAERDGVVNATREKIEAARGAAAEMARLERAKANASGPKGDRLTGFRVGGKPKSGDDEAAKKAAEKAKQDFEKLVENLRTEEEAVAISYQERNNLIYRFTKEGSASREELLKRSTEKYEEDLKKARGTELQDLEEGLASEEERIALSYAKRLEIIRKNTEEGSALRASLEGRAYEDYQKSLTDKNKQHRAPVDAIREQLLTEEEELRLSYERRAQVIRDSEELTLTEKQDIMMRLTKQYTDKQAELEAQRNSAVLQGAASTFDALAGIAESAAGKQSGVYRALFAVSKAFALADAIMKVQQAMANAAASGPFPANLGAMASVASATMGIVSAIKGASMGGTTSHDSGGSISAGKYGLVGEIGPELVKGPAIVTSRRQTAASLARNSNNGSSNVVVAIYNNSGAKVEKRESVDSRGQRRVEVVIGEMAGAEMRRPGSSANQAVSAGFGLRPALVRRG